jgi:hypothetical protein
MEPIRLRSVRPFVFDEVSLLDAQDGDDVDLDTKVKVNKFLKAKVRFCSFAGDLFFGTEPEGTGERAH